MESDASESPPSLSPELGQFDTPSDIYDALNRLRTFINTSKAKWKTTAIGTIGWMEKEVRKKIPEATRSDRRKNPSMSQAEAHANSTDTADNMNGGNTELARILDKVQSVERKMDKLLSIHNTTSSFASLSSPPIIPNPPPSTSQRVLADTIVQAEASSRDREIGAQLPKMSKEEHAEFTRTPVATLVKKVEEAIKNSSSLELQKVGIQGVRKSGKDKIIVTANSPREAEILQKHDDKWIAAAFTGASLTKQTCQLLIHFVPVTFDPSNPEHLHSICDDNPNYPELKPDKIKSARWLRDLNGANKTVSSIVLTINDPELADKLIEYGLRIGYQACRCQKLWPDAHQCYKCQEYGHQAKTCPNPDPTCARCAGPHTTRSNECKRNCGRTKCADIRQCTHIQEKCKNCGGNHRAFDKKCPARIKATAKISTSQHFLSPFFSAKRQSYHSTLRSHHATTHNHYHS